MLTRQSERKGGENAQLREQLADVTAQRDLLAAMCPAEKENARMRALLAQLQRALDAAMAERFTLRSALHGLWEVIESGVLVRDISHDHESGFAFRQIPLVQALAAAKAALADLPDAPKEKL